MERTAESAQEQAVVENLMDKQAYRIETSFMAAMDRFSSELRTLFQERMPIPASTTPPGAGRRSQESERLEPYGEGSSHGTPARAPASGYGQNFQPPTNGWGQSQPTWANSGPTRPSEMAYSPLHALAVTLGQNSPMNSTALHGGPVHTLAVHTHPSMSNTPAASSQQYGQSNPIISSLQTPLSPPDSQLQYGAANATVPCAHLGHTQGVSLAPTGPTITTETPIHAAQQQRPQNDGQLHKQQQNQRPTTTQAEAPARGLRFEDVRRMIEDGLAQRRPEAPRYTRPYPPEIDRILLPRNYRLPEFTLFSGDGHTSSIEHIGRFTAQSGEADSDAHKLRLFVHSLTGAAFSWFINLPPNSVRDWSDMERTFHEHFYQTNREITVAELARMSQATDESPRDYLQRFKTCRNWCRTSLPEREFVKMAEEGLEFEYRKKFQGIEFRDMHDLTNKVDQYASLLKEEAQKKAASKGTYYRNPIVSYAEADGPTEAESEGIEVSSAEVKIDEPFICKGLVKADNSHTKLPDAKFAT
ncbi:unnamed protein product, partial [Prunus brigantina]